MRTARLVMLMCVADLMILFGVYGSVKYWTSGAWLTLVILGGLILGFAYRRIHVYLDSL